MLTKLAAWEPDSTTHTAWVLDGMDDTYDDMSTASLGTQIILSILPPSCLNWVAKPPTPCQPNEMPSPTVVTCRQCMVSYAHLAPTVLGAKPSQPEVNPAS